MKVGGTSDEGHAVPRFCLQIRVQDETGTMSLSLFNDEVHAMSESDGFIPTEIINLIGNKYAFNVLIDDYNVKKLLPVFIVLRFFNDQEIINYVLARATPIKSQTDENTTPNEKQNTNKRPAEGELGSESSTEKKKAVEIKMQQQDTNVVKTPLPFGLNRSLALGNLIVLQRPVLSNTITSANRTQRLPNSTKSVATREAKRENPNLVNEAYSICCKKGKVMLEKPPATPKPLLDLFLNDDGKSQNFRNNIITYNSMFSFTSMGGKGNDSVNRRGRGSYFFRLHGQTYHSMGSLIPQEVVLSFSFTGGPMYMRQNYMDAMALCRWYGCPDLSIIITCNPNWLEIARYTREHNLTSADHLDVLSRVFKMKLDQPMKDVKELSLFGRVQAAVYTVEFQKRGHPHAHICLFLHKDDKVPNVKHINKYISVEIPDPTDDLNLYKLVSDFMMHGPCGEDDPSQACMVDRKCSKHFPKKFMQHSSVDSEGYPVYRRRDDEKYEEKSEHHLHNGFVIPYNATLLKRPNRVSSELYEPATTVDGEQIQKPVDEIKAYLDFRYLSVCEAVWRLFGFEVQYRTPYVKRLSFTCQASNKFCWMKMNELYPAARELTYAEFPTKYVWNAPKIIWTLRKQGNLIGRIHNVHISTGDAFYCRMLLNSATGCRTHDEIKKLNGVVDPTYKEACYIVGLLEDNNEYIECIKDATH
nr:hypothetical protein [Tanacetum cinerariifolium]